ncbi:hypothetical protein PF010_g7661 [Phytophthora fragariae]|uniref:Transmembrane protein n=1 Tax=Phytophthora fragariae TaxID=53985 RepID=A0A6A3TYG0_9STRA|nr:hypothetical protein PF010_g7661 [Phytophthora fragariae]KAE9144174.1 hypothetical protein PF006_g10865 [Phytophthora fragariae]
MARASPLHDRQDKRRTAAITPPTSPRSGPRVGVLALFSVIGLYALGFVVWGLCVSGSFSVTPSSSDSDNDADVRLSSVLGRQLRRRQRAASGNQIADIATDTRRMERLLDAGSRPLDLRCVGWRQTDSCDPQATEVPTRNRGCDQFMRGGLGGYCLMEDEATDQQIQVMHTACDTLHPSVMLSCRHAGDFVDFQWEVAKLAATIEREKKAEDYEGSAIGSTAGAPKEGVVMVIYPKLLRFRYRAASPHALDVETAFEASKPTIPPNEKIDSARVPVGNLKMPYNFLSQKYSVQIFNGAPEFDETQWCYGQSQLTAPRYKTIAWEDTAFPLVERDLLQYASEAVALLPQSAVEHIVQSDREEAS